MPKKRKPDHEKEPCIYCAKPVNSAEDWFPRWMGKYKNIGLLKDRLCRTCNNGLGKELDQVMSRQSGEAVNRWRLKIPGRKKKPLANPFLYNAQEGSPTTLVADADDRYDFIPLRMLDHEGRAPWLRQIVILDGKGRKRPIALDENFSGPWLKEAVEKHGLVGGAVTDIVWDAASDDDPLQLPNHVLRSIANAIPRFKDDYTTTGVRMHALDKRGERREGPVQISIRLSPAYRRAITKVAFHYLLKFDRYLSGREREFDAVRAFIRDGVGNPEEFAAYHSREFIVVPRAKKAVGPRHYFYAESDRKNQLRVYVRLFGGCEPFSGPPIRVNLGQDPFVRNLQLAHVIPIFSPRRDGFDGELRELRTGRFYGADVAFDLRKS